MKSRNKFLAIFIGLTCVVQSSAQTCPYIAEECTCDSDVVVCNNLHALPPLQAGPNVSHVRSVYIQNGNITSLSKNSLPPGLVELMLTGLPLTNISNDAFDTSANSLNYIELNGAKFTLPSALFKLTNLTTLHITDTPIQVWNASELQNISTTLTELYLINVGITGEPGWISSSRVLEKLDLSENKLTTISDNFFNVFNDTLIELTLKTTGLTAVPPGLASLNNLTSLDLSENNLSESEINKLLAIPSKSKLLSLSINSVGVTKMLNFSSFESLISIDLGGNNISDLTVGSLPPSVTFVNLKGNNLPSVPTLVSGLTKLWSLQLSNNHITTITDTIFANLTRLYLLDLSDNPISTISPIAFSSLKSLHGLYFDHTNLSEIPTALSELSSASSIFMDDIPSLACPCNMSSVLHTWFLKRNGSLFLTGICNTGQSVSNYLLNGCSHEDPSTTLTALTTLPTTSTTKGHASALELSLVCRYGFLLVFLSLLYRCVH